MIRKERYQAFLSYFSENQPQAETELHYENPYQLLVAVILSAQCTDKRVNIVTPALFAAFPTPQHLSVAHFDEVLPYIKSVSFMNNKTKHLIGMAKMLVQYYDAEVPSSIDELQKMPGVGRKTANVIASVVFNQPAMAVDTHVFRVSKRLGLVNQNARNPFEVEKVLVKNIPDRYIHLAHHWLILHGRYVCVARKPKCNTCGISHFCKYYEKQFS